MNTTTRILGSNYQYIMEADNGARISGYLDGEVFYIEVPAKLRRQGVAKALLQKAEQLCRDKTGVTKLTFTTPISPEGKALVEWYKNNLVPANAGERE